MSLAQPHHEAKNQVEQLIERFDRNRHVYTRSDYKETWVRVEFIDPFLKALVWALQRGKECMK